MSLPWSRFYIEFLMKLSILTTMYEMLFWKFLGTCVKLKYDNLPLFMRFVRKRTAKCSMKILYFEVDFEHDYVLFFTSNNKYLYWYNLDIWIKDYAFFSEEKSHWRYVITWWYMKSFVTWFETGLIYLVKIGKFCNN